MRYDITVRRGDGMESLNGILGLFSFFVFLFSASWIKQRFANREKDIEPKKDS
jgi:hypothetical protein